MGKKILWERKSVFSFHTSHIYYNVKERREDKNFVRLVGSISAE